LLERVHGASALLGLLQTHPNPSLSEMCGMCGYDFVMLDCEHGLFSDCDLLAGIVALAAADTAVLVRTSGHDAQAIGRYMDLGVDAIVVPNVTTAAQARELVRAMSYPPAGTRGAGAGMHRATRYGLDDAAHGDDPSEGVLLLPIIESALGVVNADDILAVEGVRGVIIGPGDLSASLGDPGDFSSPSYIEALERIEGAAMTRDKLLGVPPHGAFSLADLLARGHKLFILNADMPLIRGAMSQEVSQARAALAATE
jgi:2-keto-3-deoxy-L-rhamnonate aldolase RhmA